MPPEKEVLDGTPLDTARLSPFSEEGEHHSNYFINALLAKLEEFPEVANMAAFIFIPKNLDRRYARLAVKVFNWWLYEAMRPQLEINDKCAKAAAKFLKVFDFVISRN